MFAVRELKPLPPNANPFNHDPRHKGVTFTRYSPETGETKTALTAMFDSNLDYVVLVDTASGRCLRVSLTDTDRQKEGRVPPGAPEAFTGVAPTIHGDSSVLSHL